jgi:hypothetical protein
MRCRLKVYGSSLGFEFLYDFAGVDAFLAFGFELFDELVGLFFSPFVPHRHQQFLQEVTLEKSTILIAFLVFADDAKSFAKLLFDIVFSQLLQHNQKGILIATIVPLSVMPSS